MSLSATKLWEKYQQELGAFIWWMKSLTNIFFDVYSQCMSKIFLGGFGWNDMFRTFPSVRVVHMWMVCT
jgi:hypothetical protein